jgi:hypothetical protein
VPDDEQAVGQVLVDLDERAERARQKQYWIAFIAGVVFSALLLGWFLWFVTYVVTKDRMDWHALLPGSAMILPATFILYLLVSRSSTGKKDEQQETPAQFPAERLAEGCAQLLEAIAQRIKT